jgi:hypothetical protein
MRQDGSEGVELTSAQPCEEVGREGLAVGSGNSSVPEGDLRSSTGAGGRDWCVVSALSLK